MQYTAQSAQRGQKYRNQDHSGRDQYENRMVRAHNGGNVVHHGIGLGNHAGEKGEKCGQTQCCACKAGKRSIQQILAGNGQIGVTQRFQRADGAAIFIDHAGHGSGSNQGGNEEEENREDLGNGGYLFGITFVINVTLVAFAAAKDIPLRFINIIDLILRIPNFLIGFVDLVL